ncbi:TadE-like protein [Stackebrandtia endophytica]|uniref:TadE-like protein n=1 Tax=Stackebrandtia endophytica TaxID=1496996 RepID=A0A543AS05_9ACTN|nr:TadE/TadG family type IV pilus assembly protein [Stackebrandtia endophytica]TQL75362.1 TadE-like protein [Stackebrandtia endophytica]
MNRRPRDDGSATIQAIVIAPVLILLVMVAVACARIVGMQLDVNASAHAAARAASLARTNSTAHTDATAAATATLADNIHCDQLKSTVDGNLAVGSTVTVTVTCTVPLADLAYVPWGTYTVTASASAPIDTWRSRL